ncbi:MAG: AI-2E family transporter [bacterium]|jgi:predicted PurR-regulated permease PerM
MDRSVFWALIAYTFALLFLYLLYLILAPFGVPLVWAAVIGIATFPLYERLLLRFHGRDWLASAVMTVLVILVFVLPMAGLVALLIGEAADAYNFLEAAGVGKGVLLEKLAIHPSVTPWIARAERILEPLGVDVTTSLLPAAKQAIGSLLGIATDVAKNVLISLLYIVVMLVVLLFIYKDGGRLEREFWDVMPLRDPDKAVLREKLSRVLKAGVVGILGTCLVQGLLGGIGFRIAGLPSPVLFGSLMAVASLVPFVGTAMIWLPGAIYLLLAGNTAKGIFLLVWGTFAIGSADNIVRPLLIGGKGEMPVSVMALGAIGGFAAFGLMGVVVGPVLLSLFLSLFEIYKAGAFGAPEPVPPSAGPGNDGGSPA